MHEIDVVFSTCSDAERVKDVILLMLNTIGYAVAVEVTERVAVLKAE